MSKNDISKQSCEITQSCLVVKLGGATLLSKIIDNEVPAVVDPTLLIKKEEWRSLAHKPMISGKYIFCYFLGDRQYYRDFVQQLSKQTGLPIYYIPVNWREFSDADNLIWNAGPLDFVGLINGADGTFYVFTSFRFIPFFSGMPSLFQLANPFLPCRFSGGGNAELLQEYSSNFSNNSLIRFLFKS